MSVSEEKISNCCCSSYAGSASLDISLYNKQNSFPKASVHKIWPVCLRWMESIYLIIIEIAYGVCMCNGCLCITAAFIYRVTDCNNWEYTKCLFLLCFPPVFCAKEKKKREMNMWPCVLLNIITNFLFAQWWQHCVYDFNPFLWEHSSNWLSCNMRLPDFYRRERACCVP